MAGPVYETLVNGKRALAATHPLQQGDLFYADANGDVQRLARPSVASKLTHPGGATNPVWTADGGATLPQASVRVYMTADPTVTQRL